MDKMKVWWRAHRPSTRRLVQLYAALLYNAHLKGFVQGEIFQGKSKALCVPGLNCYSCPAAVGACPLGALQNALGESARRPAFYAVGVLLLFGLTLGRTVCGWLCPFGLIQELLHKLPAGKLKKSRLTRGLSWVKYGLLGLLVLGVPLWNAFRELPLPAFCKYVCPAGTLEGAVALLLHPANREKLGLLGPLFTWKLLVLLGLVTACIFVYRAFCRFFCPLGAIYSLMTRLALLGIRVDPRRCTGCGVCLRVCPVDIRRVGDRECVSCGKCISRCPEGAISLQAGNQAILSPDAIRCVNGTPQSSGEKRGARPFRAVSGSGKKRSAAVWTLALLILAGALAGFNLPGASSEGPFTPENAAPEASPGSALGQTLPDFTLRTLEGESFTLSHQRGRVVVLNLWATWCGPCVKELPLFESFSQAHPDAAVLAVHGELLTEDVPDWLSRHPLELPVALDEDGSVAALLGASSMLPHTVILDRQGRVLYNAPGSVTAELLEQLYQSAD